MKACLITGAAWVFLLGFFTFAYADVQQDYLLLIDAGHEQAYTQVLDTLEKSGAKAIHRFPSEGLIVRMDPALEHELAQLPSLNLHTDMVDAVDPGQASLPRATAIQLWNIFFMNAESPLNAPWTEDAPYWQNEIPDSFELDRTGLKGALNVATTRPHGADATETSEYFNGSVVLAVFTMESNGTAENWTPVELTNVATEIAQGLNNWITYEPNASLSFTYVFHNQVATTYEPIQGPSTNDVLWMQEAMNGLGYTDPNIWTNLYDYANDLRNTYATDWAYSVFVVDDTNDGDGLFSDMQCAYAYLGGPAMVMTYTNGAWGITQMDMVMSHETAHIFWALDEYHPVCTNYYPCTSQSGYLWIQNQNCDLNGTGGCLINQNCVMRNNNIVNRCTYTRGQLGLTDTDADTIPDVQDTFPDTTLYPYSPDPTAVTTLIYSGQATVVPLTRPGGTGNDISINEIAGVQYRVGGTGSWYPATASDGIWDEPVEDFTFTIGPLPLGTYLVEARATNNVGNTDASPGQDTVQVVQAPTASFTATPTSGIAPLTVNFTDTTTGYVTSWSWTFGDGGTSTQQNPSHDYTTVGTFTVSLTATGGGVPDTDTQTDLITVSCPAPTAAFTATPTEGEAPLEVTFTDTSSVYSGCDITTWDWDFGDGGTSDQQSPDHLYDEAGTYTVELTITNAGGSDTETQTDLVDVSEPSDDDDNDSDDDDDDDDDDGAGDDDETPGDDDEGDDDDDSGGGCCG